MGSSNPKFNRKVICSKKNRKVIKVGQKIISIIIKLRIVKYILLVKYKNIPTHSKVLLFLG